MKIRKAYQYACLPTPEQISQINVTGRAKRFIWNWALDLEDASYALYKVSRSKSIDDLTKILNKQLSYLLLKKAPKELKIKILENDSFSNLIQFVEELERKEYIRIKSTSFKVIKFVVCNLSVFSNLPQLLKECESAFNISIKNNFKKLCDQVKFIKQEFSFLKIPNSQSLIQVLNDLKSTRSRWMKGLGGYPRYKRFDYTNSFANQNNLPKDRSLIQKDKRYQNNLQDLENGYALLRIMKFNEKSVGPLKLVYHRKLPDNAIITTVHVKQQPTLKYTVSIGFEYENGIEKKEPTKPQGWDKNFRKEKYLVSSDGSCYSYPLSKEKISQIEKQIKFYQRRMQRLRDRNVNWQSSKNYEKLRLKTAKWHDYLKCCKNDAIHKFTHKITSSDYDVFSQENLNVKGMARTSGKSVMASSFFEISRQIDYKALELGKYSVKVDRFFPSSKLCHVCNFKYNLLKRDEEKWTCPSCGVEHQRDTNAAKNIENEGFEIALKEYMDIMN